MPRPPDPDVKQAWNVLFLLVCSDTPLTSRQYESEFQQDSQVFYSLAPGCAYKYTRSRETTKGRQSRRFNSVMMRYWQFWITVRVALNPRISPAKWNYEALYLQISQSHIRRIPIRNIGHAVSLFVDNRYPKSDTGDSTSSNLRGGQRV